MFAALSGSSPAIVNLLIDKGADVKARDVGGRTPLMKATRNADTAGVVKSLLDYGSELEAVDNDGLTPLMHAALNKRSLKSSSTLRGPWQLH